MGLRRTAAPSALLHHASEFSAFIAIQLSSIVKRLSCARLFCRPTISLFKRLFAHKCLRLSNLYLEFTNIVPPFFSLLKLEPWNSRIQERVKSLAKCFNNVRLRHKDCATQDSWSRYCGVYLTVNTDSTKTRDVHG